MHTALSLISYYTVPFIKKKSLTPKYIRFQFQMFGKECTYQRHYHHYYTPQKLCNKETLRIYLWSSRFTMPICLLLQSFRICDEITLIDAPWNVCVEIRDVVLQTRLWFSFPKPLSVGACTNIVSQKLHKIRMHCNKVHRIPEVPCTRCTSWVHTSIGINRSLISIPVHWLSSVRSG